MVYAIHQPDFLPWIGFFQKLHRCDTMILFDTVSFGQGKSWTSRVKILFNEEEKWLSAPIIKSGQSGQDIYKVEFENFNKMKLSHLGVLKSAYRHSSNYKEAIELIEFIYSFESNYLSNWNINAISEISNYIFGRKYKKFEVCSNHKELRENFESPTEYIIKVCKFFEIKNYISGTGALDFLDIDIFHQNKIDIKFSEYTKKEYIQMNNKKEFSSGLSIIDVLFNLKLKEIKEVVCID